MTRSSTTRILDRPNHGIFHDIYHVVVVAIGQNDNHPVDYMAEDYDSENPKLEKTLSGIHRKLMQLYPKAQIILATTILCHDKAGTVPSTKSAPASAVRESIIFYTKMAPARRDTSVSRKQSRCRMSLRRISTH